MNATQVLPRGCRRALAALIVLPLVLTGCARGGHRPSGPPALTSHAGPLSWHLWIVPDPPQQKGNALWVEVLGADGTPAVAEVSFEYVMPAMGSMPEMRGGGEPQQVATGLWRIGFDVPVDGTWKLRLVVKAGEQTAAGEYSVTTGSKGLRDLGSSAGGAAPAALESPAAAVAASEPNEAATVAIDPARRQATGVVIGTVRLQPVSVPVRAVGKVVVDETRLTDVTVKYKGFIGRLFVDRPGQPVRRGQPLFTLYSPELYAAQQELLIALHSQSAARDSAAPDRADYLVRAARQRLRLWDLTAAQIDRLGQTGKVIEEVPIRSPAAGVVVQKNVVAGAAVEPGMQLFRLADLDEVWIEAEVYEAELSLLHPGDRAQVTMLYLPGRTFAGTIAFVYPYLDPSSRTGRVRIELPNPGHDLKPDMLASVTLSKQLGERLVVPQDAVLYAGDRAFVFLDIGNGKLRPQRVALGQTAGELVEVVAGLNAGDRIVVSGNFLVAAESRLKLAMEQWR